MDTPKRRGRPPKAGGPVPSAVRQSEYRERRKRAASALSLPVEEFSDTALLDRIRLELSSHYGTSGANLYVRELAKRYP